MPRNTFWYALAVVAALRTLLATLLPLSIDEPYYWLWACHPSAGYFDHPPLIAWLGAPFAALGWSPIVVRLAPLVASTACAALVYLHARRLARDEAGATLAGLLLLMSPYYWVMGILFSPEGALLLTWAAVGATWQAALFSPLAPAVRPSAWIAAGAALGLALLAKFTAMALPCGLVLFFVISPSSRRWLRTLGPWTAAVTALLVVSPFLAWNARHGWQTFVFQFVNRQRGAAPQLDLGHFARFLGEMALGLSPFTMLAMACAVAWALRRAWTASPVEPTTADRADRADRPSLPTKASEAIDGAGIDGEPLRLALCLSLPTLALGLVGAAFNHDVQVYWLLCGFIPLFPVAGCWLAERLRGPRGRLWRRLVVVGALFALAPLAVAIPVAVQPEWAFRVVARGEGNGLTELYATAELAQALESLRAGMPRPDATFTAAEDHRLASQLTGRLGRTVIMLSTDRRGLEYRRWQAAEPLRGQDAIILLRAPYDVDRRVLRERLKEAFDRVEEGVRLEVRRDGRLSRVFFVSRAYGFHPERAGALFETP